MSIRPSSSTSPERATPDQDELRRLGLEAGLHAVGFTHAEPFREARIALQTRRAHGRHGGMAFTYRNPERSTDPQRAVRNAAGLVVGAWPYASPGATEPATGGQPGEIAAYAWRDHYADLREALQQIADRLRGAGWKARVVADDNALVDRAAAVRAGIGWTGKNSNVLLPGRGSFYVLGAVITDASFTSDPPVPNGCGSCRRCLDGCPTGAIVAEGVVDARRCLAWLLQAEGDFPLEFRSALGTRIYGCDDCQTVCPPSRNTPVGLIGDEVTTLDLLDLLEADDDLLLSWVHRWYIPKRDLRYVRRNALVALGNADLHATNRARATSLIARYEADVDDPMLSEHASWARSELGLA